MLRDFVLHAMCARYTQTHVRLPGTSRGLYRELDSAGVPGPSSFVCAPTVAPPRNGSIGLPATGAHHVHSVWRRKLSSTSCCSAPATTTSAVSSSTIFTATWDFHMRVLTTYGSLALIAPNSGKALYALLDFFGDADLFTRL
ncbi:hypothetical protein MTO96_038907 [Rhipicephalus appendiculatus]